MKPSKYWTAFAAIARQADKPEPSVVLHMLDGTRLSGTACMPDYGLSQPPGMAWFRPFDPTSMKTTTMLVDIRAIVAIELP